MSIKRVSSLLVSRKSINCRKAQLPVDKLKIENKKAHECWTFSKSTNREGFILFS
jgi:hypothetical protein